MSIQQLNSNDAEPMANAGVIDSLVDVSISDNEIKAMVKVPNDVGSDELETIKGQANTCYMQSRKEKYKAIAYAYIWYHTAKQNPKYLQQAITSVSGTDRSPNSHYINTVKYCFGIKPEQASSMTKYGKVMQLIENKLGGDIDDIDAFVDAIVAMIQTEGGLDKCACTLAVYSSAKKEAEAVSPEGLDTGADDGKGGGNSKQKMPKISRDYIDLQMRKYVDKTPLASFTCSNSPEKSATGLVVMVGRINKGQIDVVEVAVNDDVIEHLIKIEGKSVAAIKGSVH